MSSQLMKQFKQRINQSKVVEKSNLYQVRKVYDELAKKAKDAGVEKPDLKEEFVKLREITDNYTVPGDVCESYEAVYNMLAELDKAYEA